MRFLNIAFHNYAVVIIILHIPSNYGNQRNRNEINRQDFGDVECVSKCISQAKDSLKCRVFCGAKVQKPERFPRGIRSTNSPSVKTKLTTEQPKKKHDFLDCDDLYPKVYDTYGVSNPDVTNMTIRYSRWQNKTIARVEWDVCKECLERDPSICRGYFVLWKFPSEDWRCYQIKDLNKKYFILNDTTGFDGIKRFGVNVISYPSAKTDVEIIYMRPPAPENITTLPSTVAHITTTIQVSHQPTQDPSNTEDTPREAKNTPKRVQGETKTLKVVLGLFFAFVFCIFSLLTCWFYKRHKRINYNIPIHHEYDKEVINGAHYISYLPGPSNTGQVLHMYSWLKSHHINVIMDRMHDPKLYNSLGPKRFGENFVTKTEKVIMIISPGYLELCWLDAAVDSNSKIALNSLDKERLYSEVTYIKNELSTTINLAKSRFIPVIIDVKENDLPKWLRNITTVNWPKDGKSDRFLEILKGDQIQSNP